VSVDEARAIVEGAIAARVFPAATVEVGSSAGTLWTDPFGTLTFEAASAPTTLDTPFDLASLTKPLATTTAVMDGVRTGALRLDARVGEFFEEWRGRDRETVTIRDLLEHASGLSARLVDPPPATRREFEHEICTMPLEYEPRTQSIYSDLGFILLGFMVRLKPDTTDDFGLTFGLTPDHRPAAAPTIPLESDSRRGRMLVGEVHDNYAAALGGVAGHAGLFGTAAAVAAFARAVLRAARLRGWRSTGFEAAHPAASDGTPRSVSEGARAFRASDPLTPELVALFTTKSTVPGSSRALGWDTMLPTSSCGTRLSPRAFGHVGFTGTSLWIDPGRDRYFVLLTNRVCGGGTLDDMRIVRRAFHDALGDL
jgi:CubicO group peptidase (beta-lactamase class C family)